MLRIAHPSRTIVLRSWTNADRARRASTDALVLAPDVEEENAPAWELSVEGRPSRSVVVVSGSPVGGPLVLGAEWAGHLWLADGKKVYAFPDELSLVRWVDLESWVVEVRLLPELGVLIAVHESGVVAIGDDLTIRWSLSTDLVTGVEWQAGRALVVRQSDGPALSINLTSGAVL